MGCAAARPRPQGVAAGASGASYRRVVPLPGPADLFAEKCEVDSPGMNSTPALAPDRTSGTSKVSTASDGRATLRLTERDIMEVSACGLRVSMAPGARACAMLRAHDIVSLRRQRVDVAMVAANEVGEIVYTNPAVTKLFGYTAAEMQGQNVRALPCPRACGVANGGV